MLKQKGQGFEVKKYFGQKYFGQKYFGQKFSGKNLIKNVLGQKFQELMLIKQKLILQTLHTNTVSDISLF